jgi:pimeloyl-ACP methyl ester carboxylesterase
VRSTAVDALRALATPVSATLCAGLVLAGCSLVPADGAGPRADPTAQPSSAAATWQAPLRTVAEYESQSISWGSCADFDAPEGSTTDGFECGFLRVPLDYDDLDAGSVRVAVNRRPARSDDRLGALVVNPGGPGGSGVDFAFFDTFVASAPVVERYDLVGFDPRGVSRSEGVDCLEDAQLDTYLAADSTPDSPAEVRGYRALREAMANGCADDPVAAQMGTETVARDLDVLRAVLGEQRLDFLGKSYGTFLGAVYAQLFPERVGRFVLDGGVTPDLAATPGDAAVEQLAGVQIALKAFVADCLPRDDCPLTGRIDSGVEQVVRMIRRLDVAPLPTDDEERPLTQSLAVYGIVGPLSQGREGWDLLRTGLIDAFDGNGDTLLVLADLYTGRRPDGSYRGNIIEAQAAVSCLDLDPEVPSPAPGELQDRLKDRVPALSSLVDPGFGCEDWPFPGEGTPALDAQDLPAILVVGTTRDPATPYHWSAELAEALDGRLLTFDGDGHLAYRALGSACIDEAVDAFLLTGAVPAEGARCVAEYDD